jgi:hypothetical protein
MESIKEGSPVIPSEEAMIHKMIYPRSETDNILS